MKSRSLRITALFALTGLIGWLDYVTGDELDLFILYFVPIVWAAWKIGRRAGLAIALEGTVLWFAANVYLGHAYTQPLFGIWGGIVMLIMFTAAALTAHRIHVLLDHERRLNRRLAEALAKVKKLTGRLPICIGCKSIRDEAGEWHQIEEYFTHQSEDDFIFSQCVCPHCRVAGSEGSGGAKSLPSDPVLAQ